MYTCLYCKYAKGVPNSIALYTNVAQAIGTNEQCMWVECLIQDVNVCKAE